MSTERSRLAYAWRSARLAELAPLLRRGLGLAYGDPGLAAQAPLTAAQHAHLQAQSRAIRGPVDRPSIFVHGVLPRSGTNFAANLIARHPDVQAFPRDIYELPLLRAAGGMRAWHDEFLAHFPRNAETVHRHEPLSWLAAGMMRALASENPGQALLFKSPHMHHVALFEAIFPDDALVMVLRDGRDVIASSEATFKQRWLAKNVGQMTREWRLATEAAIEIAAADRSGRCVLWRFEDLVRDPLALLERDLPKLGLDPARFPEDALADFPVFGSSTDPREGERRWQPSARPADFKPIGRWQHWPKRRLDRFMRDAGATLARAGYS